jgi:glycerophosphoryl diester phosphodiesterase
MPESLYGAQTLVYGHRGARGYAPMNTIPSFEVAVQQGAHGVELDVHLTADGQLVVIHDFTVDATTDGQGAVENLSFTQLRELDAGAWFDPRFAGTRVPTLLEVFETLGRLGVNVEIKADTAGIEDAVAALIRRLNAADRVIVSSFNPLVLKRFRKVAPEIGIGFLHEPEAPDSIMGAMLGIAHEARHPMQTIIDADYMAAARRWSYRVNTWTVNDPVRALELRALGVDIVITDYPDRILQAYGA